MTTLSKQLSSLALAFTLALGAQTAWLVVSGYAIDTATNCWFPSPASPALFILRDGTPAIDLHQSDEEGDIVRTLDGQRVKVAERWRHEAKSSLLTAFSQETAPVRPLGWKQRLIKLQSSEKYPVAWYFLHDGKLHGRGHFVGYDTRTKLVVGYIGRRGVQPDEPQPDEQFPVEGRRMVAQFGVILVRAFNVGWDGLPDLGIPKSAAEDVLQPGTVHLLADDGLVQIGLKDHTVQYLRKDADLVSAAMAFTNPTSLKTWNEYGDLPPNRILLRTPDRVLLINAKGEELQAYVLPAELRDLSLQWLELQDGTVLVQPQGPTRNNELFWIDTDGKILRHENVELEKQSQNTGVAHQIGMSLAVPCSGLIAGALVCNPWDFTEGSESLDYFATLGRALADSWPVLLITGIISTVLAYLCYRRQRRYGLPWTGVWSGFVLLFGLPGYLGYLAHRTWPVRLPCPNCGQPVPRDRPTCLACQKEFPAPALKGIEVFG